MERESVCRQKRERERKGVSGGRGELPPLNDNVLRWYSAAEHPALLIHPKMKSDIPDIELQRVPPERGCPRGQRLPAAQVEEGQP